MNENYISTTKLAIRNSKVLATRVISLNRFHKHIITSVTILIISIPASGQDTLLNVVQWPASAGGNDHWYGIVSLVMPWVDHRDLAGRIQQGGETGYLVTITSQEENDFVMSVVQNHTNQPSVADEFYLGGMNFGGVWQWLNNEPMSYTNWASGEPNGNALAIWGASQGSRAGRWNNVPEDTTGLGSIHQLWSVIEWGPPDSVIVITDTLLNVVQWTASAGGNDHWYGIIGLVKPWVDHRNLAGSFMQAGDTGYLATITSQAENDFVMSVVQNHTNQPSVADEFYLGGMNFGGVWQWLNNEPMSYTNWASGEPNGNGNALAIWGASQGGRAGFWNDVPEDTTGLGSIHQLWSVIEWGAFVGCGDADGDGDVTWIDVDFLMSFYFLFGPPPQPIKLGDVNGNGLIDLGDIVRVANFLNGFSDSPCSAVPNEGEDGKDPDIREFHD